MKKHFLFLLLITVAVTASGQDKPVVVEDSLFIEAQDTILVKSYAKRYNPRKALLYAAVLPGLGQVYTKKYWKLPLVYGGAFLIGREIDRWSDIEKEYKLYLYSNLENSVDVHEPTRYTTTQLRRIVERSRRERDFMVIMMGGLYLLQMIDAHVDAHLKEFDLNPSLNKRKNRKRVSMSVEPTITQDALIGRQSGMAIIVKF
jgi:hypothetical protein